jgi:hypothetical protein
MTVRSSRGLVQFVQVVVDRGSPRHVPPEARIGVFDDDGTLWSEQPDRSRPADMLG